MHARSSLVRLTRRAAVGAAAALLALPALAHAQAWPYPALQPAIVQPRELQGQIGNAGDYGTTLVGQFRDKLGPTLGFSIDVGVATGLNGDLGTPFLVGGSLVGQLTRSTVDMPLDLAWTAGADGAFASGYHLIRIPVGVIVGHRFPIEGSQVAISPFVAPRLNLDFAGGNGSSDNKVHVAFDLGGDLELNRQISLRAGLNFDQIAGSNQTGFAFGLAYHPPGLR